MGNCHTVGPNEALVRSGKITSYRFPFVMNEMRDNESQTFDPMCCRFQCKLTCFVFSSLLAKF